MLPGRGAEEKSRRSRAEVGPAWHSDPVNSPSDAAPIVTITFNPALDLSSSVDVVAPHHKLRCSALAGDPGGGGINVSRVCARLGEETLAVLPVGGGFGTQLSALLDAEGVPARFVPIAEPTRPSVTIAEGSTGHQFRFVFPGPDLTDDEVAAFLEASIEAANDSRCVVISGSMPGGVPASALTDLVAKLPAAHIIVDTSGDALAAALDAGVHLVKPSARELAGLVGRTLRTEDEVEEAAQTLANESPVHALLVSIGAGGAILAVDDEPIIRLRAPTVQVHSAVGAGDSMVAGIACGLQRGQELVDAVRLGVAAGTAAVLSEGTQLCSADDVERLLDRVTVD